MANQPTDNRWPKAFQPEVIEPCGWSCHCRNSALREVVHALEWFARGNPERLVFSGIEEITKKCNGRFRKPVTQRYHSSIVEKIMAMLRDQHALSKNCRMLVTTSGGQVWRAGWVLPPHDFLFRRHDRACTFVGFDNALAARGLPALPTRMPRIWVPEFAVESAEDTTVGVR